MHTIYYEELWGRNYSLLTSFVFVQCSWCKSPGGGQRAFHGVGWSDQCMGSRPALLRVLAYLEHHLFVYWGCATIKDMFSTVSVWDWWSFQPQQSSKGVWVLPPWVMHTPMHYRVKCLPGVLVFEKMLKSKLQHASSGWKCCWNFYSYRDTRIHHTVPSKFLSIWLTKYIKQICIHCYTVAAILSSSMMKFPPTWDTLYLWLSRCLAYGELVQWTWSQLDRYSPMICHMTVHSGSVMTVNQCGDRDVYYVSADGLWHTTACR